MLVSGTLNEKKDPLKCLGKMMRRWNDFSLHIRVPELVKERKT